MEFWEKEYLRVINEEKEEEKQSWNNRNNSFGGVLQGALKTAGRVLAAILIMWVIVLFASFGIAKGNNIDGFQKKAQNVMIPPIVKGTYVDGLGFADMMNFLDEWKICAIEFCNDVAASSFDLSDIEIRLWNEKLIEYEERFDTLKYDVSYSELVEAYRHILELDKSFLQTLEGYTGAYTFDSLLEHHNIMVTELNALNEVLVTALEKNGIRYEITGDQIRYWYQKY